MHQIKDLLESVLDKELVSIVLSNPREKGDLLKIKIRPILKGTQLLFQEEQFQGKQVFHNNRDKEETITNVLVSMEQFRQMQLITSTETYTVLVSKKGKVTITHKKNACKKQADLSHNRKKQYILKEGTTVPFLQDLGVMTKEGKIVNSGYDKYRQINRFLEFVEDVVDELPKNREITVIDFGCGKSYLTFAMYYFLHELRQMDVRIIGLDLKEDVIQHCSKLARKYHYEKLDFLTGDIADYTGCERVDMVVTLHACDTATDYALKKVIDWNAKVILSVPCCQHELNRQIQSEVLKPVLKYGLLKERMAALVTDGLRAEYLESVGYDTQILEFIDMEHTPKNILIRGVKRNEKEDYRKEIRKDICACEDFLHVSGTLGRLLGNSESNGRKI